MSGGARLITFIYRSTPWLPTPAGGPCWWRGTSAGSCRPGSWPTRLPPPQRSPRRVQPWTRLRGSSRSFRTCRGALCSLDCRYVKGVILSAIPGECYFNHHHSCSMNWPQCRVTNKWEKPVALDKWYRWQSTHRMQKVLIKIENSSLLLYQIRHMYIISQKRIKPMHDLTTSGCVIGPKWRFHARNLASPLSTQSCCTWKLVFEIFRRFGPTARSSWTRSPAPRSTTPSSSATTWPASAKRHTSCLAGKWGWHDSWIADSNWVQNI